MVKEMVLAVSGGSYEAHNIGLMPNIRRSDSG